MSIILGSILGGLATSLVSGLFGQSQQQQQVASNKELMLMQDVLNKNNADLQHMKNLGIMDKQYDSNQKLLQQEMAYQKEMNDPVYQVSRMKAAGLNPIGMQGSSLSIGSTSSPSASISGASSPSPAQSAPSASLGMPLDFSGINSAIQALTAESQIKKNEADARKTNAEADNQEWENSDAFRILRMESMDSQNQANAASAYKSLSDAEVNQASINQIAQNIEESVSRCSLNAQQEQLFKVEALKYNAQIAEIAQGIEESKSRIVMNNSQALLNHLSGLEASARTATIEALRSGQVELQGEQIKEVRETIGKIRSDKDLNSALTSNENVRNGILQITEATSKFDLQVKQQLGHDYYTDKAHRELNNITSSTFKNYTHWFKFGVGVNAKTVQ